MSTFGLIEYKDANPAVKAVTTTSWLRKTDYINNFWKAVAHDPALSSAPGKTENLMAPGALDPLTKELSTSRQSPTIATIASLPTPRRPCQRHDPEMFRNSGSHRHGQ
jgi:hypothetical protein